VEIIKGMIKGKALIFLPKYQQLIQFILIGFTKSRIVTAFLQAVDLCAISFQKRKNQISMNL
jgi:hypothetical protein